MNDSALAKHGLIIFASSGQNGNTAKLRDAFNSIANFDVIDLTELDIGFFDYEHKNKDDDFLPTIEKLVGYEHIVFASPVYWYTMCAQMKIFFDRFSDILSIEKDLGRKIKAKKAYILATGYDAQPKRSFEEVFVNSFKYLEMSYRGILYASCPEGFDLEANRAKISAFYHEHFAKK